MAYADQEMSGSRIAAIIIVALIHVGIGYLLVTGLAYSAFKEAVERVTTVDIEEPPPPEEEPPPPPPEEVVSPPPPVAPPPPIRIAPNPPPVQVQPNIPPPAPPARIVPPPAPPAAVAPPPPPPPPPPPAVDRSRAAAPDGQARWARRIQENYPSRALRREIQGTVGVAGTVGPDGRVTSCRVTRPADPELDAAACDGMTRFARYTPALDRAGNPTSGTFSTSIVYQLN
ncbi:energy transducer TonB [Aurantiacibacter luteus]|uniref:Energy transducer TonB n=1 Tax=Aurantiacibacter luteus TaxID=1581420 RepID=A0A0G9MUL7_9SPHN|nr:energy transducer TonB [Aurantiacibacter luteus]KLE34425.1 energy transducer TonB [Aurantiacibacter luteus]